MRVRVCAHAQREIDQKPSAELAPAVNDLPDNEWSSWLTFSYQCEVCLIYSLKAPFGKVAYIIHVFIMYIHRQLKALGCCDPCWWGKGHHLRSKESEAMALPWVLVQTRRTFKGSDSRGFLSSHSTQLKMFFVAPVSKCEGVMCLTHTRERRERDVFQKSLPGHHLILTPYQNGCWRRTHHGFIQDRLTTMHLKTPSVLFPYHRQVCHEGSHLFFPV